MKKNIPKLNKIIGQSNISDHTTTFEKKLEEFLKKHNKPIQLSVNDIKDMVWNDRDNKTLMRLVFLIAERNNIKDINTVMSILSEAWNNFPRIDRNGLSPREMVLRLEADPDFDFIERPDFNQIFIDDFPEKDYIEKINEHDWQWCFSGTTRLDMDKLEFIDSPNNLNDESGELVDEIFSPLKIEMAKELLSVNPLLFKASIILANHEFQSGFSNRAKQILLETITNAKKMIPSEFEIGKDLIQWGFLDNRPYILLLGEHATLIEAVDGIKAAIPLYEEIVSINPNDNTGVRSFLATAYIATNQLDKLFILDNKYPDDMVTELSMGTVLAWIKVGNFDLAKKRIQKNKKIWKNLYSEILSHEHIKPDLLRDRILMGGEDEAWLYWINQGNFWMTTKGAREFLQECIK